MHGPASTGPLPDIIEALLALTEMNGGLFRGERALVKDIVQNVNKMLQVPCHPCASVNFIELTLPLRWLGRRMADALMWWGLVGIVCVVQKHDNAMVRHILELKRPEDAPPPPAGAHQ